MSIAEALASPLSCFGLGLSIGLWVAANAWIIGRALGYRAGLKYCTEELEPVRVEIASLRALGPIHHISEEMRSRVQAAAEGDGETRH